MDTSSVVTEIQRLNSDLTVAQIVDIINNVVKLCLKTELDANVYISPTTGDLPYLVTTAGTFQYTPTISGVTFWKIKDIVADLGAVSGAPFNAAFDREYRTVDFLGRRYCAIPTRKKNEVGTDTPSVIFLQDPGSQSTLYRIMAYESPAEISSVSVAIPVDDRYRYSVIVPACQAIIDGLDNGRYEASVEYIQASLVPKIQFGAEKEYDRSYSSNYSY